MVGVGAPLQNYIRQEKRFCDFTTDHQCLFAFLLLLGKLLELGVPGSLPKTLACQGSLARTNCNVMRSSRLLSWQWICRCPYWCNNFFACFPRVFFGGLVHWGKHRKTLFMSTSGPDCHYQHESRIPPRHIAGRELKDYEATKNPKKADY